MAEKKAVEHYMNRTWEY